MNRLLSRFLVCLVAAGLAAVSVRAADGPELIQVVKNGTNGVTIKNHVGPVTARGDYVYVAIHYSGLLQYYQRDPANGTLTFAGKLAFEKKDMSIDSLVWANGRLYFHGGSGHETCDGDSRGLHWLDVDAKTGVPAEKGTFDIPIASGLIASPDQKHLYLLLRQKHKVVHYRLAADGTPEKADEIEFADAKGDVWNFTMAPDGKALYGKWRVQRDYSVGCIAIRPDGSLTAGDTYGLAQLTDGITWPLTKFGYGWGSGFGISPDGLSCYADFCNYGGADFRLAVFTRDPKSHAIAFRDRIEAQTGPRMCRIEPYAFEPDGTRGYFASGPESGGNGVGWFTRDSATGKLTFGGMVKDAGGGPTCLYLDSANGCLYAGTWGSQQLLVMKTGRKTTRP